MAGRSLSLAVVAALLLPQISAAQTAPPDTGSASALTLPTVEVIGTSPLPGVGIDRDKVPANVQSVTSTALTREGSPSLVTGLTDQAGGVNANANLNDPFQPDILYRGFEASPVLGTPQGLAVYQNGVRVNEAFGDTVNWDLIPDIAIDRVDILSANPVYGLNALGGAVIVTMKNGFTHPGFHSELAGGSFGQRGLSFEYGQQSGNIATYLAGRMFESDGWRRFSPDHVKQVYADIGARGNEGSIDVSFTGANNFLSGEGTAPAQELAVNRSFDFTTPQNNVNQLAFVSVNGSYEVTDALSLQGNLYRREFHQNVVNGDTTHYTACVPANGLLCQRDGATPLIASTGALVPDISAGGVIPIGQTDLETIHAIGVGGALQTTYTGKILAHDNNFVFGGSIDHSNVDFQSSASLGVINPLLQVVPAGFLVDTPENLGFIATPVGLSAANNYYGIFLTDTFNLTSALAITASGRYNIADIALTDHLGSNLSGRNRFSRFNPAIGGAYRIADGLTAYAGYSEGNRTPTPNEIECSNPAQPCFLPSSLSSDPPTLKQVVSRTYEAGLRGAFRLPDAVPGRFAWSVGLFRTELTDDIYGVATSISSGFFENIGSTRRQGIETGITYKDESWSVFGAYSLVEATFQSPLTLPSPNNPLADEAGTIHVVPGDRLPGIPQHQLKLGADYRITPEWTLGGVFIYYTDQFLRGDEANQNPTLPGYAVVNLHSSYALSSHLELFANLQNAFDARYATFGSFGNPAGIGTPGIPAGAIEGSPGVDNRFLGPAPPLAVFGGVRVRF